MSNTNARLGRSFHLIITCFFSKARECVPKGKGMSDWIDCLRCSDRRYVCRTTCRTSFVISADHGAKSPFLGPVLEEPFCFIALLDCCWSGEKQTVRRATKRRQVPSYNASKPTWSHTQLMQNSPQADVEGWVACVLENGNVRDSERLSLVWNKQEGVR